MANVVQFNSGGTSSTVASTSLAFTTAVNPGNTLLCVVGSTTAAKVFTISDSVNGGWSGTALYTPTQGSRPALYVFSFPSTAAGTPNVTASINVNANIWLTLLEVNGLTGSVDGQSNIGGSGTSVSIGPTAALQASGELSLAVAQLTGNSAGWAAGGAYTLITAASARQGVSYLITPDATAQNPSFSWTTSLSINALVITIPAGSSQGAVTDTLLGQGWV